MIIPIKEINIGVYKLSTISTLDTTVDKLKSMLKEPNNFLLSFRASDNSFHEVNSEISQVMQKNMNLILKGISLSSIASEITNTKESRIKRYIIWKKDERAFLIGETLKALKKASIVTN